MLLRLLSLYGTLVGCLSRHLFFQIQADVETDEVYAQMTLQPLSPVWELDLVWRFVLTSLVIFYFLTWKHSCSKIKRMCTYCLQSWVLPANSQPIIFVKHWQQVTQALMEDFLFLAGLLKKSFLLLYVLFDYKQFNSLAFGFN